MLSGPIVIAKMTDQKDNTLKAIVFDGTNLSIIDQLLLPDCTKYIQINDTENGWNAIRNMQIRGAPAIAILGLLSLSVELQQHKSELCLLSAPDLIKWVNQKLDYLLTSRPTAVNLRNECEKLKQLIAHLSSNDEITSTVHKYASEMLAIDEATNRSLGKHGAEHIMRGKQDKVNVLTICNTGSLATAAYGTALGVARSLHSISSLERLYFLETRPYLQGARLTAFECEHDHIPATMVCDGAAAWLMHQVKLSAVVVGCDRVARNGDTANKIGTYSTALLAKAHNVPFYVAMPCSTYDPNTSTGADITIEYRPQNEMTYARSCQGQPIRITSESTECWNPAFDVTPAELVTGGYITERGVLTAQQLLQLNNDIVVV